MKAVVLARRRDVHQTYRLLLFDDRLEEVGQNLLGSEVRRLFFDEAESATVHASRDWAQIVLAGLFGAGLLALGVVLRDDEMVAELAVALAVLGVGALGLVVFGLVNPPHVLHVRASDHALSGRLPRFAGRREDVLARLARAIELYQARHRPPEPPAGAPPPIPTGTAPPES